MWCVLRPHALDIIRTVSPCLSTQAFEGEHHFHNFAHRVSPHARHARRAVLAAQVHGVRLLGADQREFVCLSFAARGFLPLQVRKMVGFVVAVMRGRLPPDLLPRLLADDCMADVPAAPPSFAYLSDCYFDRFEKTNQLQIRPRGRQGYACPPELGEWSCESGTAKQFWVQHIAMH